MQCYDTQISISISHTPHTGTGARRRLCRVRHRLCASTLAHISHARPTRDATVDRPARTRVNASTHTHRVSVSHTRQCRQSVGTARHLVWFISFMRCLLPPVQSCSRAAHKPTRACARHVSRSSGRMAKNPASTTTHIEQPVRAASPARPAARSRNATSETSDAAHAHNGLHRLINIVANGR